LLNREISGVVGDVVVAKYTSRSQGGADRVGATADSLTGGPAVGGGDAVGCQEPNQRSTEGGISAAVGLVRGIGRYRSIFLLDGKLGRVVDDVILTEHRCRAERRTDFVGTARYRLTGRAAISSSYTIRCKEANQGPGKRWVDAAVDFAGRIRCDRSVLL